MTGFDFSTVLIYTLHYFRKISIYKNINILYLLKRHTGSIVFRLVIQIK